MVRSRKGKGEGCNSESKKKKIDENKDVDPQLWHAVAGKMVQIPPLNSKIIYFPQGHAEHAYEPVHFPADSKIQSQIPCRVAAIHYRADPNTDEVYAKLRLVPLPISQVSFDDDTVAGVNNMPEIKNKYETYTKALTWSDVNKCGGFYCPKNCAERIFPPLDYSGNTPSQHLYPTDVHGETWEFKHVYKGTPKRHLLTGWRDFVTNKVLDSGDSLVFVRAENGDLHIGIQRSEKRNDLGKVKAEDVIEAVNLGVDMQPFDVIYYPRLGTPEFFVKTSLITTALHIRWSYGMKFQMAIETEDSRKSWFTGTIASVEAADPAWPDSLWRRLQIAWDVVPDLLSNTKRLNPWQVEILSGMQGARHDATTSMTVSNNPTLQMASTSEIVSCSKSISTQPSENPDHAKPKEFMLFGQKIQIDSGNESAEKKITNSSSGPLHSASSSKEAA